MKITKEQFDKLYDPDISKREYEEILGLIDDRFYEIMVTMCPSLKRSNYGWVDYSNCNYESDDSGGEFDPHRYRNNIGFGGELTAPEPYDMDCEFPTRWLWQDFEEEMQKEIAACAAEKEKKKQTAAKARETLKLKKAEMRKVIEAKLSKEELRFIKFK